MPPRSPSCSADFRGRGRFRRSNTYKKHKRKASLAVAPSKLTNAGCNYLGSYAAPSRPCESFCEIPRPCESPCVVPSACEVSLVGPRPAKKPKQGPSCTLQFTRAASPGSPANSSGASLKRALEATGGDGRTPTCKKDLRATKDQRASIRNYASACIRGTGLCPMTGWTINEYCPACHG